MTIAPASVRDVAALARIHAASFESPWSPNEIGALLEGPGGFGLVVGQGARHGFILCRVIVDEAEILTLAVEPGFRRKGIAASLTEAAAALAASLGAHSLFLEVAEDNPGAISLYVGAGFSEIGRRRGYYARPGAPSADALVMRRDLNRTTG